MVLACPTCGGPWEAPVAPSIDIDDDENYDNGDKVCAGCGKRECAACSHRHEEWFIGSRYGFPLYSDICHACYMANLHRRTRPLELIN